MHRDGYFLCSVELAARVFPGDAPGRAHAEFVGKKKTLSLEPMKVDG